MNWDLDDKRKALLAFTRKCFALRHSHAVLRRRHFFSGEPTIKGGPKDLSWIRPDGREMSDDDWRNGENHVLGMLIYGEATDETDDRGRPIKGETLMLITSTSERVVRFQLPVIDTEGSWAEIIDTADCEPRRFDRDPIEIAPFSLVLLRFSRERRAPGPARRDVAKREVPGGGGYRG
jgi:glycogen operon protein